MYNYNFNTLSLSRKKTVDLFALNTIIYKSAANNLYETIISYL